MGNTDFKKYECVICGFIYDEAEGLPEDGIPPGTRWADIPEDWECPEGFFTCFRATKSWLPEPIQR